MRLKVSISLRTRLFAAIIGSIVVIAAITMVLEYDRQYRVHLVQTIAALEEQGRALQVIRRSITDEVAFHKMVDDFCAQMNTHISPGHHILVLDPNGHIAVSIRRHGGQQVEEALLNAPVNAEVMQVADHRLAQYRLVDKDGSTLVLAKYLDHMEGILRSQFIHRAIAVCITALVTLVCIWLVVAFWVMRPLQKLTAAIKRWAKGDLAARAEDVGPHDFQLLAREFNTMAEELAAQEQNRIYEMEQATQIQKNLLPKRSIQIPGLHMAAEYHPAAEVAGDLYDVIPLSDGRVAICVMDVCGHGISAALLTGVVKMSLHRHLMNSISLSEAMIRVNEDVLNCTAEGTFVTACVGIWDSCDRTWTYGAAGHSGGLHLNAQRVHELPGTAPLLGVLPICEFPTKQLELRPGERLFLFTDGLIEIDTPDGFFDAEHLGELIARTRILDVNDQAATILQHVTRLAGENVHDDITLVILRVEE